MSFKRNYTKASFYKSTKVRKYPCKRYQRGYFVISTLEILFYLGHRKSVFLSVWPEKDIRNREF